MKALILLFIFMISFSSFGETQTQKQRIYGGMRAGGGELQKNPNFYIDIQIKFNKQNEYYRTSRVVCEYKESCYHLDTEITLIDLFTDSYSVNYTQDSVRFYESYTITESEFNRKKEAYLKRMKPKTYSSESTKIYDVGSGLFAVVAGVTAFFPGLQWITLGIATVGVFQQGLKTADVEYSKYHAERFNNTNASLLSFVKLHLPDVNKDGDEVTYLKLNVKNLYLNSQRKNRKLEIDSSDTF